VAATRHCTWSLSRDLEWAPAASDFAADAYDCIMVTIFRIDQICGANSALNGELPSDHPLPLQAGAVLVTVKG